MPGAHLWVQRAVLAPVLGGNQRRGAACPPSDPRSPPLRRAAGGRGGGWCWGEACGHGEWAPPSWPLLGHPSTGLPAAPAPPVPLPRLCPAPCPAAVMALGPWPGDGSQAPSSGKTPGGEQRGCQGWCHPRCGCPSLPPSPKSLGGGDGEHPLALPQFPTTTLPSWAAARCFPVPGSQVRGVPVSPLPAWERNGEPQRHGVRRAHPRAGSSASRRLHATAPVAVTQPGGLHHATGLPRPGEHHPPQGVHHPILQGGWDPSAKLQERVGGLQPARGPPTPGAAQPCPGCGCQHRLSQPAAPSRVQLRLEPIVTQGSLGTPESQAPSIPIPEPGRGSQSCAAIGTGNCHGRPGLPTLFPELEQSSKGVGAALHLGGSPR